MGAKETGVPDRSVTHLLSCNRPTAPGRPIGQGVSPVEVKLEW